MIELIGISLSVIKSLLPWFVAAIGGVSALVFRERAKIHRIEAEKERARADNAETIVRLYGRIDENLSKLEEKQRHETQQVENSDPGDRSFFDRGWD